MFKLLAAFAVSLFLSTGALAQMNSQQMIINRVAVNQNQIAFTYAGKIWLVDRNGETARPLNDGREDENAPVFSPDGKRLAFSRNNGNDWDVWISDADGTNAKRVTMMPEDDFVTAWTPDGKDVVFETTRDEENVTRLYKISVDNPTLAVALPMQQAFQGSFSPDGNRIAFNPRTSFFEWRYYRGGMTAPIWITDLKTGALEKLPNQNYNDRFPMWLGDKIYFVSDRTGISNLFVYDQKTKQTKQLTKFEGQGIRSASAARDAIVFVQDGRIHLFDLNSNQERVINVAVSPDTSELRPRNVPAMRSLDHILPSASGDRIVFGARGEVLLFDAASGEAKNLTNTSGAAERFPAISPDNKSVAYFSDESGEYALYVRSLANDSVRKINVEQKPSFYWDLVWSPDSKKLSFSDRRLNLWLANVERGTAEKVDASDYSAQESWNAKFSPDSRFLAYAKRLHNRAGTIFIRDLANRKNYQITDGITHAQLPVFDANGKYLYFVSSPNAGMSEFSWGVLNGTLSRPLVIRRVHALILSKNAPSPLLPNNQPNPEAKVSEAVAQVQIDFDNVTNRFVDLPLPQRDYSQLAAGKNGKLTLVVAEWSAAPGSFNEAGQSQAVYGFDFARGGRLEKIVGEIDAVDLTLDGSRLLYRKGRDYFLISAETAAKPDEGKLNFNKMEVRVNPAEEWRQMFRESMRIMRDWFYDPNYHGQNLVALERYYAAYLPTVTRRADLNALMRQMLGSVSVSHLQISGGDAPPPSGRGNNIGLLGADYEIADGLYRFRKILRSTPYSGANGSFNAPLGQLGVDVREGDYLLEVNGNKVEIGKNILSYFENTVGKPTKIVVSADASGANPRSFTVYPAPGENRLRRANWAENNRKLVEKLSGGRLGYIFIEGYNPEGIYNAFRGLNGYADKAGVIIDQRYNGGGITPDYLIEWMQRKPLYYYMFRGGDDIATPVNPAPPVKVMITNEYNGSAAETGAFMFKLGKVGKIVGKRTGGAGIGPYFFTPRLIDGGRVQLPNRAAYSLDGSGWGIENTGVAPDFDVELTPQDSMNGKDAQLEKAVEVALADTQRTPVIKPKRPPFPVHLGKQETVSGGSLNLPAPGSAFPAPVEVKPTINGKYAAFIGQFDTPMGLLVIKEENGKLFGDAGGERIELVADASTPDKFNALGANVNVRFERDAAGKIVGVTVQMPNGREMKGKKVN